MRCCITSLCVLLICCLFHTGSPSLAQTGSAVSALRVDSGWVNVDQAKLYYEMAGKGDTIVFVHDGIIHSVGWDYPFRELAGEHTVIRYDRRGYGRSPKAVEPYSDVGDLLRVFDQLKVSRACVIGTSAGARLTLDFAVEHPERVSSIVVVGPAVSGLGFSDHFFTKGGRFSDSIRTSIPALIHYYFLVDPYEMAPENVEARQKAFELVSANLQNADPQNMRMVIQLKEPALGRLGTINVPTLILVGEYDQPDIQAHAGAINAGIRNSQRIVITHAGHLIPMEKPEEFTNRVRSFLKSAEFRTVLNTKGAAEALRYLRQIREKNPGYAPFTEAEMNMSAYQRLYAGEVNEAVDMFRINIEAYPQSWNVYDSMGEAYLAKGDTTLAIENYEKSLKLNPNNTNGATVLQQIKNK